GPFGLLAWRGCRQQRVAARPQSEERTSRCAEDGCRRDSGRPGQHRGQPAVTDSLGGLRKERLGKEGPEGRQRGETEGPDPDDRRRPRKLPSTPVSAKLVGVPRRTREG